MSDGLMAEWPHTTCHFHAAWGCHFSQSPMVPSGLISAESGFNSKWPSRRGGTRQSVVYVRGFRLSRQIFFLFAHNFAVDHVFFRRQPFN
jgi:hypothetical protein